MTRFSYAVCCAALWCVLPPTLAQTSDTDLKLESVPACIKSTGSATKCFAHGVAYTHLMCSLQWQLTIQLMSMGSDKASDARKNAHDCLSTAEKGVGGYFRAARGSLTKNKAASEALKDAYATYLTALRGINPEAGETKLGYQRRQSELKQAMEHRLNRLEVEL